MNRISAPRIESIHIKNFRAIRNLELTGLTPITVFLGPNGSGKSTVFDVFAFLSECFTDGLRPAWNRRGRFKELRNRGVRRGPIVVTLQYREKQKAPLITYHLSIGENKKGPFVSEEWLAWRRGAHGQPFRFLEFYEGEGWVISGKEPDEKAERIYETLDSPELLAVNTLGQLAKHPRVSALRRFISGWHLSYLSSENIRTIPEAGPEERLSKTGDNLPNVIQYLQEQHPARLETILKILTHRVPRLEAVDTEITSDNRLVLRFKDETFENPILSKYTSDGTLKLLSYLTIFNDPEPPPLIGIEEPENHLHPRLLVELADECRIASDRTQLMMTTHSPFLVNGIKPEELWIFYRNEKGHTQAVRAADMPGIESFMHEGAQLGHLWAEGHFNIGDPLVNSGGPPPMRRTRFPSDKK